MRCTQHHHKAGLTLTAHPRTATTPWAAEPWGHHFPCPSHLQPTTPTRSPPTTRTNTNPHKKTTKSRYPDPPTFSLPVLSRNTPRPCTRRAAQEPLAARPTKEPTLQCRCPVPSMNHQGSFPGPRNTIPVGFPGLFSATNHALAHWSTHSCAPPHGSVTSSWTYSTVAEANLGATLATKPPWNTALMYPVCSALPSATYRHSGWVATIEDNGD